MKQSQEDLENIREEIIEKSKQVNDIEETIRLVQNKLDYEIRITKRQPGLQLSLLEQNLDNTVLNLRDQTNQTPLSSPRFRLRTPRRSGSAYRKLNTCLHINR